MSQRKCVFASNPSPCPPGHQRECVIHSSATMKACTWAVLTTGLSGNGPCAVNKLDTINYIRHACESNSREVLADFLDDFYGLTT